MKVSRRRLVQTGLAVGSALPLLGCEKIVSRLSESADKTFPEKIAVSGDKAIDPDFHLLSRAQYGLRPGDLEYLRDLGHDKWLEEQLHPESIDDKACELRAKRFETLHLDPGTCYEYKKPVLRDEMVRHALLRAVYSKRQLYEVMVGFWTDHLNINIDKGDCIYLKPADDRLVIRRNALGKFKDLICASALSPAMLVYLDGKENIKAGPSGIPNENYGRELLELHTLGVHGGYTQKDVYEVARCLTGWRLRTGWSKGKVYFDPGLHDDGAKRVLGHLIEAGGGEKDLDRVVDIACNHPSTAQHIATKLVRRFVSEDPPKVLIARVADTFQGSDGDIKSTLRTLFHSDEFKSSKGSKFKRPFHYIVSCMRASGADTFAHQELVDYLNKMGQGPFQYPTPDGYPDDTRHWLGTLLWRWNFAFAVANNQLPSAKVSIDELTAAVNPKGRQGFDAERLLPYFIGRSGTKTELAAIAQHAVIKVADHASQQAELLGLILSSPAFQRY
jgi:Protein of unknown function (DUF1800)